MIRDITNSSNMGIESSVRKPTASKSQPPTKPTASVIPAVPKSAASLAAATGLPSDKLSASIVSFARFFSLPLKPQLLADIRRQALAPQMTAQTTQAASANASAANPAVSGELVKTREGISLAAAAAESKGTELTAKGLESYAEAVDPDLQRRRKNDDEQRRRRDKDQNEQTNVITAGGVKKTALEQTEQNPVLDILNRLQGKNGGRWIVLPFDFCEGDREYFVSMRILLDNIQKEFHTETRRMLSQSCSFLTLDVLMKKDNEEDRRLFIFESANEKTVGVSVCVWQELPSKDQHQLKKEISEVFNISPERVNFRTSEEAFPFEAEFGGTPTSVDEAV